MLIVKIITQSKSKEEYDDYDLTALSMLTDIEHTQYHTKLAYDPFSSHIIAIGIKNTRNDKIYLFTTAEKKTCETYTDVKYSFSTNETELVEKFWLFLNRFQTRYYITFNGRDFDFPYLMLRSVILGIEPADNLMKGTEYTFGSTHCDLLRVLTFRKFTQKRRSLEFYCSKLGLTFKPFITQEEINIGEPALDVCSHLINVLNSIHALFTKINSILS